jgi:hypothetical protein
VAAPNLKSPTSIYARTAPASLTTTLVEYLSNPANSGKVLKVVGVRAANVDGVSAYGVDVTFYRGTTHTYQASTISVPADATLQLISRDEYLYLEEGDAIYAKASTAGKIDLTISYEEIS